MVQGKGWQFRASLLAVLVLGCGGSNGNEYGAAALGLATMIGATAIYRGQTGGCWAACTPGYACDRTRGTCYRAECVPACSPNETCFLEDGNRFRCVDTLGAGKFGAKPATPLMSSVPVSSAAPAINSVPIN
jgi:hypothetical protein